MQVKNRYTDEPLGEFDISPGADLSVADLREANLRWADLYSADLRLADLREADLREANLRWADLRGADLSGANLRGADLREADLSVADLREADLSDADLSYANLSRADLSGAKGLQAAREFMQQFTRDDLGYIVAKGFGDTAYDVPEYWTIEPGAFIEEVVNQNPTEQCACGVNFTTLEWVRESYPNSEIWRCRIRFEDAPDITVPYNTDGKARCGRLELLERVE